MNGSSDMQASPDALPAYCQKCGTAFEEGREFCTKCGMPRKVIAPTKKKGRGFAVTSFILGIFLILVSFVMMMASLEWKPRYIYSASPVSIFLSPTILFLALSAVFGLISFLRHRRKLALTGLALSAISVIFTIVSIISVASAKSDYKRQIAAGSTSYGTTGNNNIAGDGGQQVFVEETVEEQEAPIPENGPEDFEYSLINHSSEIMITGYRGDSVTVGIPETIEGKKVTGIGSEAFDHKDLEKIAIPPTVVEIGEHAFGWNHLTSVIIPDSVRKIDEWAFIGNQLEKVTLPAGLEELSIGVFANNNLNSIVIPDSVRKIAGSAFHGNYIREVNIPEGVTSIGERAFGNYAYNSPDSVIIPSSVKTIGDYAFESNKLTRLVLPEGITGLGINTFGIFTGYYKAAGMRGGEYTRQEHRFYLDGEPLPGQVILLTDRENHGVYITSINGSKPDQYGTDGYYYLDPGTYKVEAGYTQTSYGLDFQSTKTYTEDTVIFKQDFQAMIYRITAKTGTGSEGQDILIFNIGPAANY